MGIFSSGSTPPGFFTYMGQAFSLLCKGLWELEYCLGGLCKQAAEQKGRKVGPQRTGAPGGILETL